MSQSGLSVAVDLVSRPLNRMPYIRERESHQRNVGWRVTNQRQRPSLPCSTVYTPSYPNNLRIKVSGDSTSRAPLPSRQTLSRDSILEAGLRLIDRDGLDAFSIRRLGDELGYSPMMIYRHVKDKDDLLEQVASLALGELPVGTGDDLDWRERLILVVRELHSGLLQHPGVTEVIMRRPPPLASLDRFREAMLQALHDGGLSPERAVDALTALVCYVLGYAHAYRVRGATDREAEVNRLHRVSRAEFPRLAELADIYAAHVSDRAFELGLQALVESL
jgi:TetR/AcrR family transcriptional regulator, tetracycline repressor protein